MRDQTPIEKLIEKSTETFCESGYYFEYISIGTAKELIEHAVIEAVKYGMYLADPNTQNAPEEAEDYYKEVYETPKS